MLIVIPMAGTGERYRRAGHQKPKPLIEVDGRPMIENIIEGFNGAERFLFIVRKEHAEETELLEVLSRAAPTAEVIIIEGHKLGPVETLLRAADHIPPDEPVALNYCDFGVDWSFRDFSAWTEAGGWDGAMTSYKGFHPHSLGPTLYAYMQNDGERVTAVREKGHFTPDRMSEYASSGLYYFRRGRDLVDLARELVARGETINGEYYVSMLMSLLIERGGRVGVYDLRHFYQWGTPEDLREYQTYGDAMRSLDGFRAEVAGSSSLAVQVIPMAGRGQRFRDQGYTVTKPFIDTAGAPMVSQAMACLPRPSRRVLVALPEFAGDDGMRDVLARLEGGTEVVYLDGPTEGQACTALLGAKGVDPGEAVLFAPCDTGYIYDVPQWLAIEADPQADVVVWTATKHLPALWRPQMYGFVHSDEAGRVLATAVKRPVEGVDIKEQDVILGTFYFPKASTFFEEMSALVAANDRVNGEFYLDTIVRRMVEKGRVVRRFRVTKYLPWGTPEELKTFDYWNEVFRRGQPWR